VRRPTGWRAPRRVAALGGRPGAELVCVAGRNSVADRHRGQRGARQDRAPPRCRSNYTAVAPTRRPTVTDHSRMASRVRRTLSSRAVDEIRDDLPRWRHGSTRRFDGERGGDVGVGGPRRSSRTSRADRPDADAGATMIYHVEAPPGEAEGRFRGRGAADPAANAALLATRSPTCRRRGPDDGSLYHWARRIHGK